MRLVPSLPAHDASLLLRVTARRCRSFLGACLFVSAQMLESFFHVGIREYGTNARCLRAALRKRSVESITVPDEVLSACQAAAAINFRSSVEACARERTAKSDQFGWSAWLLESIGVDVFGQCHASSAAADSARALLLGGSDDVQCFLNRILCRLADTEWVSHCWESGVRRSLHRCRNKSLLFREEMSLSLSSATTAAARARHQQEA